MLISLNWLRRFVDLPDDLDPHELAERFTMVCAEVEGVDHLRVSAQGLIAAGVLEADPVPDAADLTRVRLDLGSGRTAQAVTAAPGLTVGCTLVFAPPGASVAALGEIRATQVAGLPAEGMILPGDALGIALAAREAVLLDRRRPEGQPGAQLDEYFVDDWVIEVDNKSITHRPDLWGHYGVAREVAAMYGRPLQPYPVTPLSELCDPGLPELPIDIDDPQMCPRYSGLVMRNLDPRPAPLPLQLLLGHVGLRPIDCMVDLTNLIMFELGQPMHAFDGDRVDRIEVGLVEPGTRFTTLDDVERTLPPDALMILSNRQPVALAGIMGGADTEIGPQTQSVLLESANFNSAVIRRCATALGHRTDASARFEKSLDPANTVLGIQRFVHLARDSWPAMTFASRLSDCYPEPADPVSVDVDPEFIQRFMGHPVSRDDIRRILAPLDFAVEDSGDLMRIGVPSFRATKDIAIEADVIEEIARCVGYGSIEPRLPDVKVRSFEPNAVHELEQRSLRQWTAGLGYSEIHGYLWYDADWCRKLGFETGNCLELRNPIAAGMHQMRQTLLPGMLAALERNRHHLAEFKLVEIGSTFTPAEPEDQQHRRLAVLSARRGKGIEDSLLAELRGALECWSWETLDTPTTFRQARVDAGRPWEHEQKTATVVIGDLPVGRVSAVPVSLRRAIDTHLAAWSIAWAELDLSPLVLQERPIRQLEDIPAYPLKELDFTAVVTAERTYESVVGVLDDFSHPLLKQLSFVTSYEGKTIGSGKRSLTFRARIGSDQRTLVEDDLVAFRASFTERLTAAGLELPGKT